MSFSVIKDARKPHVTSESIMRGVAQGILAESGLPMLQNVIQGVGKKTTGAHGADGVAISASGIRDKTRQTPGTLNYIGSQKRRH